MATEVCTEDLVDMDEDVDMEEQARNRGTPVDMVTAAVVGLACGYFMVQLLTLIWFRRERAFRPKQPHILVPQLLAAMVFSIMLLVVNGHFFRGSGWLSYCQLWDVWGFWISLSAWLNSQALRVVKVHQVRVLELEENLSAAIGKANSARGARRHWLWKKVRVHVLFARDLLINMAPWLLACVLATALQAKCLQVRKGNCKWRYSSAFVFVFFGLLIVPVFRTMLLGYEVNRLKTKTQFNEFALLKRGMLMMAGVVAINITLHVIRNQTDVGASDEYRVAYRQINTLLFVAVVVYWQRSLIARDVWWALIDPEDFHERTMADVKGGVGIRASKRGSLSLRAGWMGSMSNILSQRGSISSGRHGSLSGKDRVPSMKAGTTTGGVVMYHLKRAGTAAKSTLKISQGSNRSRRSSKKPRNCSTESAASAASSRDGSIAPPAGLGLGLPSPRSPRPPQLSSIESLPHMPPMPAESELRSPKGQTFQDNL
jgi:hypothetical protein